MHPVVAIAAKDVRLLLRDRAGLFFTVIFPVVFASVFGMVYSGMGGRKSAIQIAVVDQANSPASRSLIAALDRQEVLETIALASPDEARDLVRRGDRSACLVIPAEFGDLASTLLTGTPARLELGIDPSRTQERAMIEGLVAQAAYQQLTGTFQDADSLRRFTLQARQTINSSDHLNFLHRAAAATLLDDLTSLADRMDAQAATPQPAGSEVPSQPGQATPLAPEPFAPIRVDTTEITGHQSDWHATAFSITFAQGVVWALIGCAASFSISLVIERAGGTLLRLRAAPVSATHVIAGKGIACVLTTLAATMLLIILGVSAFGLRIGNPPMLAAALLASSVAFVGVMMVLSVLGKTPRAAGPVGYAILLSMAILGGGMMPRFMMPAWMQSVGMASPVTWTVVAVENAVFRGATWGQQALPLLILLAIGGVGTGIGAWLFSRSAE